MKKAIIGKKIGMTQLFDQAGKVIPVTVVEAGPCVVTQKKTIENDGYESVQIGYGEITEKHLTKPLKGHFAKADVAAKKFLREFRLDDCSAVTSTFSPTTKASALMMSPTFTAEQSSSLNSRRYFFAATSALAKCPLRGLVRCFSVISP